MNELKIQFNQYDLDGLKRAIARNPEKVKTETKKLLVRAMAEYNKGVIRNPWQVGGFGGGSPVDTANLRDTHIRRIRAWEASISADKTKAPYAWFVHEGTSRMKSRPWLDYVFNDKMRAVRALGDDFLKNVVNDLAK